MKCALQARLSYFIMSVCMQCYAVPRNTALLISLKSVPENLVSESVEEKVQYQGE